jgi:H+/Cl- antiporter ClcA
LCCSPFVLAYRRLYDGLSVVTMKGLRTAASLSLVGTVYAFQPLHPQTHRIRNSLAFRPLRTCSINSKRVDFWRCSALGGKDVPLETNGSQNESLWNTETETSSDHQVDSIANKMVPTNGSSEFSMEEQDEEDLATVDVNSLKFRTTSYDLVQAAIVGSLTGFSVAIFKLSIEAVREFCYQQPLLATYPQLIVFIPAAGGLAVGSLLLLGAFPPGLRGTVKEIDQEGGPLRDFVSRINTQLNFLRKSAAAVVTLGTGCSLGPEGPCVEIGMSVARACMDGSPQSQTKNRANWNLLLLSCGAAAGVAAGFNAPIAGVFFALEIMQNAFASVRDENNDENSTVKSILSTTDNITPVLLASVLAALISRTLLGNHLVLTLTDYSLKTPLIELPLYLLLGAISGVVAFLFSRVANLSQSFFAGDLGTDGIRSAMQSLPPFAKPLLGGLSCGIVGLYFPQILFFGYETLNSLLANNSLPTTLLLSLLFVKTIMTAVAAGSGLIGGTFAPALFLGAMTGASFHNIMSALFQAVMGLGNMSIVLELADVPAYAMVGAASVLAALFRAPLTASLLLFELTRDYDVILPLMASAGVGSVVGDILEEKFERAKLQRKQRRDEDPVSWGDLSSK